MLYIMNGCFFISHAIQFLAYHFLYAIVFFQEKPNHLLIFDEIITPISLMCDLFFCTLKSLPLSFDELYP